MTEHHMVAKLTPMPTENAWSQAYAAGKLCAVLSLTVTESAELLLPTIGKEILTTLEQEFFTLEEKTLPTIKHAVTTAIENVPHGITAVMLVGVIQDNILYVCTKGSGKVLLLRNGILGKIADENTQAADVQAFSGFLEEGDAVFFGTHTFFQTISEKELVEAIDSGVEELAERIMPTLHSTENVGDAAGLVLLYKHSETKDFLTDVATPAVETAVAPDESFAISENIPQEQDSEETDHIQKKRKRSLAFPKLPFHFPVKKKFLFLVVALLLLGIFSISVYRTYKKQHTASLAGAFQNVYPQAQKKYEEGQSLLSLNKNLAHDSFLEAQKILNDNKSKFPQGTPEAQQIQVLLTKVNDALSGSPQSAPVQANEVPLEKNDLLKAESGQSNALAAEDPNAVYLLSNTAVTSIDRKSGKTKQLLKNDTNWTDPVSVGVYGGNLYVLDRKNGLLKFIAGDNGYGKTMYFTQAPDLTKAVTMAIDGSVYILSTDGSITKFTRGKPDTFQLTGIDKSLTGATKLFTTDSFTNLYVMDKANGRIVVTGKDGTYKTQYAASVIQQATDFEVDESNKVISILSQGKLYQISM